MVSMDISNCCPLLKLFCRLTIESESFSADFTDVTLELSNLSATFIFDVFFFAHHMYAFWDFQHISYKMDQNGAKKAPKQRILMENHEIYEV